MKRSIPRCVLMMISIVIASVIDMTFSFQPRSTTTIIKSTINGGSISRGVDIYRREHASQTSSSSSKLRMGVDLVDITHFSQLLADSPKPICPAFGEPGWAPFCFLQGNPLFNAFDSFQGENKHSRTCSS